MTPPQPRDGYCASGDLQIGDIPLPSWITSQQVIASAADEIDAHLGFLYQIPINTTGTTEKPVPKVVGLILKRINAALATGRAILQLDVAGENARLHAYGASLVKEALDALRQIELGEIVFENVPPVDPGDVAVNGPLISNLDPESNVEAFYNRIGNPNYSFFPPGIPRGDGYFPPNGLVGT